MGLLWYVGLIAGWYAVGLVGINKIILKAAVNAGSGGKLSFRTQVFDNELPEESRRTRYTAYLDSMRRLG